MKVIAVIPHPERPAAYELAGSLADHLTEIGIEVRIPDAEATAMSRRGLACSDAELCENLDLAISVGGDGTMLRAVSLAKGIPVLGVNLGALGFLAEVEPEDVVPAVLRLVEGEYDVEERMTIDGIVLIEGAPRGPSYRALNEITVEKQNAQRLINVDVLVNGEAFTSFRADGVVVATPTGSTAYALSLRGPIVSPSMQCICVVPIAPHGLFDRTLVLAPWEEVEIAVRGDRQAVVAVDGRLMETLEEGGRIQIRKGAEPARFVRFKPHRFQQALREKFRLGGY